jgi:hypothetical protein
MIYCALNSKAVLVHSKSLTLAAGSFTETPFQKPVEQSPGTVHAMLWKKSIATWSWPSQNKIWVKREACGSGIHGPNFSGGVSDVQERAP